MKGWRMLFIFVLCLAGTAGWAMIRLPSVLSSGMVLQQQSVVNIWGWGSPGEKVTLTASWLVEEPSAIADATGKWLIRIPTGRAGGGYSITIRGTNTIVLSDLLFGEVWLCSGQSNMEFTIKMLGGWKFYRAEKRDIKKHDYSQIRFCQVEHAQSGVPLDSCRSRWTKGSLASVAEFSATAWFFGECLYDWLQVPIGLISSNIGGTPAEAWTDSLAMASDPGLHYYLNSPNGQHRDAGRASVLYNAMIHPLTNYVIKGVIWYQGETNILDADLYGKLFPAMIQSWRRAWNTGDFPFYFVQIAPFDYKEQFPAAAYLREAQMKALSLPNTGMAVTMDIGNTLNIHPKNKREVGQRLAFWALSKTYGKASLAYSGPVFNHCSREGNGFRIFFDFAESLETKGGKPVCFTLAGNDGKFRPAGAVIEGKTVVVSSESVPDPVYIRYAFSDTDSVNLFNQAGLPAVPFRTDTIPLLVRNVNIEIKTDSLENRRYLTLSCAEDGVQIHFTTDGSDPGIQSPQYLHRVLLDRPAKIRACAFKGPIASAISGEVDFLKHRGVDKQVATRFAFSPSYKGGKNALLDGIRGSAAFYDGQWQGYLGVDFEGTIDLGQRCRVDSVGVSALRDENSWIFLPLLVDISTSVDGVIFSKVAGFTTGKVQPQHEPSIRTYTWKRSPNQPGDGGGGKVSPEIRYIRIYAKNIGKCPKWHPGSGEKSWLFLDEITIW
ncbi:MAG: sialate O-acetylesterase [Bacteroidota bacterium]